MRISAGNSIMMSRSRARKKRKLSYAKWGIIFLVPFFTVFAIFTLYPQIMTISYSFFNYYEDGLDVIGPAVNGGQNYISLFTPNANGELMIFKVLGNTAIMWVLGAIPQLILSLGLGIIFTSSRLKIKGTGFFKSVFYMPNLIMASAFALLLYALFSLVGPINQMLVAMGAISEPVDILKTTWGVRGTIGFLNCLIWFGNTTILIMAGIMGIDESLFESARIDGAGNFHVFKDITMPLLKPIFVYVAITSLIGGLQMFDVPQVMTGGKGTPDNTSKTLIMYLNDYLTVRNYGMAAAVSVILFVITALLSIIVFKSITKKEEK